MGIRIIFPNNGGKYEGGWDENSGQRDGIGCMIYPNGAKYKGGWENNQRNGRGVMTYPNGNVYKGMWKNDEKDKRGIMEYVNGDQYKGEWKKDKKEGKGEFTFANGDVYKGWWKNNIMSYGTYNFLIKDGLSYLQIEIIDRKINLIDNEEVKKKLFLGWGEHKLTNFQNLLNKVTIPSQINFFFQHRNNPEKIDQIEGALNISISSNNKTFQNFLREIDQNIIQYNTLPFPKVELPKGLNEVQQELFTDIAEDYLSRNSKYVVTQEVCQQKVEEKSKSIGKWVKKVRPEAGVPQYALEISGREKKGTLKDMTLSKIHRETEKEKANQRAIALG